MTDSNKISLYSLADLKNTTDDAIPNYLNSLKFRQSHTLSDIRLALGYSAFLICAATFYWDYKLGFEGTKYYTAVAVVLYTVLNGALTFWIWGVEKGKVYVGTSSQGDKIEISTSTEKHLPIYYLTITYYNASNPTVPNTLKISRPFTHWFDTMGKFVALPFQQMFASEVPVIGKVDQRRVVESGGRVVTATPDTMGLQQTLDGIMAGRTTGLSASEVDSNATPRKGGKSKRKA